MGECYSGYFRYSSQKMANLALRLFKLDRHDWCEATSHGYVFHSQSLGWLYAWYYQKAYAYWELDFPSQDKVLEVVSRLDFTESEILVDDEMWSITELGVALASDIHMISEYWGEHEEFLQSDVGRVIKYELFFPGPQVPWDHVFECP